MSDFSYSNRAEPTACLPLVVAVARFYSPKKTVT